MLQVTIKGGELYNSKTNEFITVPTTTLNLEHSLLSISKWESRWCKPFISKEPKTLKETIDYIRCMTITQNVDPNIYSFVDMAIINDINGYIEHPMTATTITDNSKKSSREIITSELIYCWMTLLGIPYDPCQKWHLNRLLMLINVCRLKSQKPKKMSKSEIFEQNRALNAARRAKLNSKG